MHLSIWQLAGISLIWGAAGARIGWLWCDYRRWCQRIDRERRERMAMALESARHPIAPLDKSDSQ